MMLRLLRDRLSTWSTPGVALTYFSRRHDMVFSTSFGPRPGARVPMMSTGGVSSGNVSTLIRGVTTPAKTTSPMQIIRTAIGFRSGQCGHRLGSVGGAESATAGWDSALADTRSPSSRSARPSVTTRDPAFRSVARKTLPPISPFTRIVRE